MVDPLITIVVVPADCELVVGLRAELVLCEVECELDAVELVGFELLTLELLDRTLDDELGVVAVEREELVSEFEDSLLEAALELLKRELELEVSGPTKTVEVFEVAGIELEDAGREPDDDVETFELDAACELELVAGFELDDAELEVAGRALEDDVDSFEMDAA